MSVDINVSEFLSGLRSANPLQGWARGGFLAIELILLSFSSFALVTFCLDAKSNQKNQGGPEASGRSAIPRLSIVRQCLLIAEKFYSFFCNFFLIKIDRFISRFVIEIRLYNQVFANVVLPKHGEAYIRLMHTRPLGFKNLISLVG